MNSNLRPSGIEGLGDMAWGTHFCLFYETREDLLDFFIPFFKAGLEHQELCLCVASEPLMAAEAERAMREAFPDFDRYLAEGQIEITPHTDWYLKEGHFDEQRVLQGWIDKLDQALAKGFSGVRFAANILLEKRDWANFARYEGKLEETLHNLRIEGLCAYNLHRYSAANVLDVMRHHQLTLARRDGAWEPLEGAQLQRAHEEVLRMNNELELRVAERTMELAAANEQLRREIMDHKRTSEALRANESRLQTAIAAADIVLWERDLSSGHLVWLGHHEKLLGFAPGELSDNTLADFEKRVHPEDIENLRTVRQRALEERSEYSHEYRVVWRDDSIHWIRAQGRFIYNEAGQPIRLYGAVLDITERKQAEEALRESEEKFSAAFSASPVALVIATLDGRFVEVNQAYCDLLGSSREELIGKTGIELGVFTEEARQEWVEAAERNGGVITNRELSFRLRNGHSRTTLACVEKITFGGVPHFLSTILDITERKQAEEALRESEEKFSVAFRSSPIGLVIATMDGKYVEMNQAFCDLLGYSREDLLGKTAVELGIFNEETRQAWVEAVEGAGGKTTNVELSFRVRNGTYRTTLSSVEPITLHGVPHRLSTVLDITERKRAEEALRKSEQVLREAESLGHTGSWEQNLVTGELFNTEENLRIFFGNDRSKGVSFEDYAQVVHPDDRQYVLRRRAELLEEEGPGDIEYRVVWPDGSVHVIFGRATVVRDEVGQPIRVYGTNVDISERKRAEEETKHQAARAETLARIAARLNKQLDLEAVIHAVCQEAVDTFQVSQATMSLYDAKRDLLDYAGGVNIPPEYAAKFEPISRAQFDEFIRTMGPVLVVPDIQALPHMPNAEFSAQFDVRTVVTVDMRRDQQLIGVLVLGVNDQVREFDKDELTLLKAISDQAAQAIANARLFQAVSEHAARMEALVEISRTFAKAGLDYQSILNTVARRTAEMIGDACVITLFSDDAQRSFPVAFHHSDPKALSMMQDALMHTWQGGTDTERYQTLLAGDSVYIPSVNPEEFRAALEPEFWAYFDVVGISSVMIVPLQVQAHVIGTLGLTRDRQGHHYTHDDLILLQNIADQATMSIQNARLFEQAQAAHERVQALSRRLLNVQESERRALTSELHDRVGQNLTGLSILLQNMKALLSKETAQTLAASFDDAQALVEDTTRQIRDIMAELHLPELEDYGLAAALETYAERVASRANLQLIADLPDLMHPPLPSDVQIALFRAAQEAISNVLKHANATQLEVTLQAENGSVRLRIEDDGRGFDPNAVSQKAAPSWGLEIMRERIESISGKVEIESQPGQGTRVTFETERPQ